MVKLRLYGKNWARFGADDHEVESDYLPRAGEIIEARELLNMPDSEVTTFIVIDITHECTNGNLIPVVVAHQQIVEDHGNTQARVMELRDNGWLYPSMDV